MNTATSSVTRLVRIATISWIAAGLLTAPAASARDGRWTDDPVATSRGCEHLDHAEIEQFLGRYLYPALVYSGSQEESAYLIPVHYAMATTLVLRSQVCLAEALDLKQLSVELEEQIDLLTSGTSMSWRQITKQRKLTSEANAEIDATTARIEELSPEQRKRLAWGTTAYLGGTYSTWRVFRAIEGHVGATKEEISQMSEQEANIGRKATILAGRAMSRVKLAKDVSPVLRGLHSHTMSLYETSRLLIRYAKEQNIEIPADATDQLAELTDWV